MLELFYNIFPNKDVTCSSKKRKHKTTLCANITPTKNFLGILNNTQDTKIKLLSSWSRAKKVNNQKATALGRIQFHNLESQSRP